MKYLNCLICALLSFPFFVDAVSFQRNLSLGSSGVDVLELQKLLNQDADTVVADFGPGSPGNETNYFGQATKRAVYRFQEKYRKDILVPSGLFNGNGFVGPSTRYKLSSLSNYYSSVGGSKNYPDKPQVDLTGNVNATNGSDSGSRKPIVKSVYPEKVKSGDVVTVNGENFSKTGNNVLLQFLHIEARFENLPSVDGKTIVFKYHPPEVKLMTKDQILALPPQTLSAILDPVKAVGGSIDDIISPYRNIKNDVELKDFLAKNGHSFDELYDKFYVTVENTNGKGVSKTAVLSGLRKLTFGLGNTSIFDGNFMSKIKLVLLSLTPKVYAQGDAEGGYNTGIIMYCTCGDGYMTYITDYSQNGGSGLYYWSSSFVATVGNPMIFGPHLGFFNRNAGVCIIGAEPYCAEITGNTARLPWGEGM